VVARIVIALLSHARDSHAYIAHRRTDRWKRQTTNKCFTRMVHCPNG